MKYRYRSHDTEYLDTIEPKDLMNMEEGDFVHVTRNRGQPITGRFVSAVWNHDGSVMLKLDSQEDPIKIKRLGGSEPGFKNIAHTSKKPRIGDNFQTAIPDFIGPSVPGIPGARHEYKMEDPYEKPSTGIMVIFVDDTIYHIDQIHQFLPDNVFVEYHIGDEGIKHSAKFPVERISTTELFQKAFAEHVKPNYKMVEGFQTVKKTPQRRSR